MEKIKIALDIDGVLADTGESVRTRVLSKFGLEEDHLTPGDYTNIYLMEDKKKQDKVNKFIRHLFLEDAGVYAEAEEIKGAWIGASLLQPVAYITRRPEGNGIGDATRDWLRENHFPVAPVHFIPRGTCKSTKAAELGVDVLVEDSPYEIVSCRENGLRTLIMRYHYNEEVLEPDSEVVHNWKEVLDWYEENKYGGRRP